MILRKGIESDLKDVLNIEVMAYENPYWNQNMIFEVLVNKTDKAGQSSKSAYLGAFLLGVAFSITSFSCTVPVGGTLLVVAATGTAGGMLTSLYGMIVYGLVFAAPFVALSFFPKALDKIPNSGAWM